MSAGCQRSNVHAELQRQVKLFDQRRQPAGRDRPRIAGHHQHPHIMRIQLQVVSAHFHARRRDQIGQRPACRVRTGARAPKGLASVVRLVRRCTRSDDRRARRGSVTAYA